MLATNYIQIHHHENLDNRIRQYAITLNISSIWQLSYMHRPINYCYIQ